MRFRDWKHVWLNAGCPWDAAAIWFEARWEPLSTEEKIDLALKAGFPDWIDGALEIDENGELVRGDVLAIHAYCGDDEVPRHMVMPRVDIEGW